MTNFMFMIIVVIVLAVIILFGTVFGKQLRVKMKGRTDEVMRQNAQTPEGARKTRERAEGSRIAYDSSSQAADRRLAASERERNARQILEEAKRQRGK